MPANTNTTPTTNASPAATDPGPQAASSPSTVEPTGLVASYNPLKSKFPLCTKDEWAAVGPTVREAVAHLHGLGNHGLRAYLTGMTRLAVWAHREGLPLDIDTLLSHQVIEAHTATLTGSAGTFRTQLRRLAAVNGITVETTGAAYGKQSIATPYTTNEVRALLGFAQAMSNQNRRSQLTGFVLLGAACGFSRGDLRGVCKNDVHEHNGVCHVRTQNRCTPILEEFRDDFEMYLHGCQDGPFVGVKPGANITDRMTEWVGERAGLPKLSGDRLRGFFVLEHLRRGTPVLELLAISGLVRAESIDQYLPYVTLPATRCSLEASSS